MTEIEKTKKEIEVLTAKLALLEEMERTKTPAEEAYKNAYGVYPTNEITYNNMWSVFQKGYSAAQEDYKVGEYQPEELKTLYQMLYDDELPVAQCKIICEFVEKWMSQYNCDYVMCAEYLKGYEECMLVLKENLK
jgi:hypothetical protein